MLECVQKYVYLGIEISASGSFQGAIKSLCDKAKKAIGRLRRLFFIGAVSCKFYISLFQKVIVPIFTYACEIWGAYIVQPSKSIFRDELSGYFKFEFEKIYIGFLKYCLGVHRKSSNLAVLGELGQLPISLKILRLVCKNWYRIVNLPRDSLLYDSYLCNVMLFSEGKSTWLQTIKDTLYSVNLRHLWDNCGNKNNSFPDNLIRKGLSDKFRRQWNSEMNINDAQDKKLRNYVLFKNEFKFENYLQIIKDFEIRKNVTRLRISAHNLAIEKGRHKRPTKLPLEERTCNICNTLEDEIHFLINCQLFCSPRLILFQSLEDIFVDFNKYSDLDKFKIIMSSQDTDLISKLALFIKSCIQIRGNPL